MFSETLRYRDRLVAFPGLHDVRTLVPDPEGAATADQHGMLWLIDPDACCALCKVEPLETALAGFETWVSGRKRYHGGARTALPLFEMEEYQRIKINPLAGWSKGRVEIAVVGEHRLRPAEIRRDVGLGPRVDPKKRLNAASAAFGEGGIHTHRPKIIAKLLR